MSKPRLRDSIKTAIPLGLGSCCPFLWVWRRGAEASPQRVSTRLAAQLITCRRGGMRHERFNEISKQKRKEKYPNRKRRRRKERERERERERGESLCVFKNKQKNV